MAFRPKRLKRYSGRALHCPLGFRLLHWPPSSGSGSSGRRSAEGYFRSPLCSGKGEFESSVRAPRIGRRESDMKKSYAKSLKEYESPSELDAEKILAAMK